MSDEVQRVEVITSVQRRRCWSVAEKIRLVEDYNERHPHRALGMRSPRQFTWMYQPAVCPV